MSHANRASQTATAYLIVDGAARAISFYESAFRAKERMRITDSTGRIAHAEIEIGNSTFMLADEHPEMGFRGPVALGGTAVSILLYVPDVDATFSRTIAGGATPSRSLRDEPYGDRSGTVVDPFGHVWTLATHVEDVSAEELQQRLSSSGHHVTTS